MIWHFVFKEWGQSYSHIHMICIYIYDTYNTYDIYDVYVYINIVKYTYIHSLVRTTDFSKNLEEK